MAAKPTNLTPADAKTIIKADDSNAVKREAEIVERVAQGRALTAETRGELEGTILNAEMAQISTTTATSKDAGKHRSPGKHAARDLAIAARRQLVLEARTHYPPFTIRQIAERLKIAVQTVMRDIAALREQNAHILDGSANAEILGRAFMQLDILYGKAISQAENYTSPTSKAQFQRNAAQALEAKIKLMLDTGVLKKAPDRQEVTVKGDATSPVAWTKMEKVAALRAQLRRPLHRNDLAPTAPPPSDQPIIVIQSPFQTPPNV